MILFDTGEVCLIMLMPVMPAALANHAVDFRMVVFRVEIAPDIRAAALQTFDWFLHLRTPPAVC